MQPGLKYSGLFFFFKYKQVCYRWAFISSFLDYWKKHGKIDSEPKKVSFYKALLYVELFLFIGRPMTRVSFRQTFLKNTNWQQKHLIWPRLKCGICLMNPSATSSLLTTPDLNWEVSGITWSPRCSTFKLGWGELLSTICCKQDLSHPLSELSTTSLEARTKSMWDLDISKCSVNILD